MRVGDIYLNVLYFMSSKIVGHLLMKIYLSSIDEVWTAEEASQNMRCAFLHSNSISDYGNKSFVA